MIKTGTLTFYNLSNRYSSQPFHTLFLRDHMMTTIIFVLKPISNFVFILLEKTL